MPKQPHPQLNLPVYTVSGRYLGRVVEVEVDSAGLVLLYHVAPPFGLRNLWRKRLLITPAQVVQITVERMVVEDAIVREPVAAPSIVPEAS